MTTASGREIAKHRGELEAVFLKIMRDHGLRCREEGEPCCWQDGALEAILCDLEEMMERYHMRMKAAA